MNKVFTLGKVLQISFWSLMVILIAIYIIMISACASMDIKMSQENTAAYFNKTYLSELAKQKRDVAEHNAEVRAKPDGQLTEEELKVRNEKRSFYEKRQELLEKAKPMLDLYNNLLLGDQPIPDDLENRLEPIIRELAELTLGG